MTEFLRVISAARFVDFLRGFNRLTVEKVPLDSALDRVLAEDVISPENLPQLARSTVDGYAVRAEDTFGASETIPALLEIAGTVTMGAVPDFSIGPGQAVSIATGGTIPPGADAVVMVEYTNQAGGGSVEVSHPVTSKSNIMEPGEDVRGGEPVLPAGRIIRPQEAGILAALGVADVGVFRRPAVAVISTGDEVVPIGQKPGPGQIRDANAFSISALVRTAGANPIPFGIVRDDAGRLRAALEEALAAADVVAISGGSSVGTRDLMVSVATALPGVELLAHGVAIRPGKPTLLARREAKAIFGLPGHPVSALLVAHVFLAPFLGYLQGRELRMGPIGERVTAVLPVSLHSTVGLQEFVRVRLEMTAGGYLAHPVFGKSGILSTMVKADGVIVVPPQVEGLAKGDPVEVIRI